MYVFEKGAGIKNSLDASLFNFGMSVDVDVDMVNAGASAPVCLISRDGVVVELRCQHAQHSVLLKDVLSENETPEDIPLPNVAANELRRVVEFLTMLSVVPYVPIKAPLNRDVTCLNTLLAPAYYSFVQHLDKDDVRGLLVAADYMDIPALVNLCAAQMALFVKSMSDGEKRQFFDITPTPMLTPTPTPTPKSEDVGGGAAQAVA